MGWLKKRTCNPFSFFPSKRINRLLCGVHTTLTLRNSFVFPGDSAHKCPPPEKNPLPVGLMCAPELRLLEGLSPVYVPIGGTFLFYYFIFFSPLRSLNIAQ